MYSTSRTNRMLGYALTSAMAGVLLAGCATQGAPRGDLAASKAQAELARGNTGKAIANAEAAVQAEPRNAAYRAVLGSSYLEAGRFGSAATSFADAMALGDASPRTALSLALALAGDGRYADAVALLGEWDDAIAPADLGLAYALAGQPQRAVQIMSDAIRAGDNTPKVRQNLAYAYALGGQWKEARLMAAQDVPADQVGDRIQEWALMAQPEAWQHRVAVLIGAPAGVADPGQPTALVLGNTPGIDQLALEAMAPAMPQVAAYEAPAPDLGGQAELPAVAEAAPQPFAGAASSALLPVGDAPPVAGTVAMAEPVPAPAPQNLPAPYLQPAGDFQAAFATIAPVPASPAPLAQAAPLEHSAVRFMEQPVVQAAMARVAAESRPVASATVAAAALRAVQAPVARQGQGTHLVQLGSFGSEQAARRAWSVYAKKYPELARHDMVITEAVVKGKRYWRVSASGYDRAGSAAMCGRVKNAGEGCFAYAQGRPMPGAVDTGVRMAMR